MYQLRISVASMLSYVEIMPTPRYEHDGDIYSALSRRTVAGLTEDRLTCCPTPQASGFSEMLEFQCIVMRVILNPCPQHRK